MRRELSKKLKFGLLFLVMPWLIVDPTLALGVSHVASSSPLKLTDAFSWQQQSSWSDQRILKGLRETNVPDQWELQIRTDDGKNWLRHSRIVTKEMFLLPQPAEAVSADLPAFNSSLLVGEVSGVEGVLYVVGVVTDFETDDYLAEDGVYLKPFTLVLAESDLAFALEFAAVYVDLYDGTWGGQAGAATYIEGDCKLDCEQEHDTDIELCAVWAGLCNSAATAGFIACALGCGGAPPCELACLIAYNAAIGGCGVTLVQCQRSADNDLRWCLRQCLSEP